jgi:hypothetical protein
MTKGKKSADDLGRIMSDQLDVLTGENVTDQEIKTAAEIANMVGKTLKLCTLRLQYPEYLKAGGAIIEQLEASK